MNIPMEMRRPLSGLKCKKLVVHAPTRKQKSAGGGMHALTNATRKGQPVRLTVLP
jgi:hypothetical protein